MCAALARPLVRCTAFGFELRRKSRKHVQGNCTGARPSFVPGDIKPQQCYIGGMPDPSNTAVHGKLGRRARCRPRVCPRRCNLCSALHATAAQATRLTVMH